MKSSRKRNRGIEENTMAILDFSGIKETRDVEDDRLAFLEAVRAASLVSETGTAPTSKMFQAIFQILKDGTSLELTMESYKLLSELDKRFPRVYLSHSDTSTSTCTKSFELVVVKEAWSPFALGPENPYSEREATCRNSGDSLDSSGFSLLTQNIAQAVDQIKFQVSGTKLLGDMLLFQYLVNVLEEDFLSRNTVYKETMNWALLRESFLNMLLGSRRINYKSLMKDYLSIIYKGSLLHAGFSHRSLESAERSSGNTDHDCDAALATALIEVEKATYMAVQKLLMLIMELDMIKKQADMHCYTSRADGVRSPLVEIILDELTYNKDFLSPFLQVFSEPKWKLEIILQYFWKYITKPSVRTRRSNNCPEDTTFVGVLRCLSSDSNARSIVKKLGIEVAQVLLAHAFQAYLSLQHEHITCSNENIGNSSLVHICKDIISTFHNIGRIDKQMEITPFGKEALFTAAMILSTKS